MAPKFSPPSPQKIANLLLDSENPRIPKEKQSLSQDDLTLFIAKEYNAIAVARSIASHQYFPSEPLIAIKAKGGKFIVLEGNRRLAALRLLRDSSLRGKLSNQKEWDEIKTANVPDEVPVLEVSTRREVAPIIGYRHISGIQQWDSYSKARYIASQVKGGLDFEKTALEVGEKESEVRSNYRNYQIAEQITKSGVSKAESDDLVNNFGIFTRAMQSKDLRDFIGAPAPEQVSTKKAPIPTSKKAVLKELTGYLFGPKRVLEDSRDITKLGKVIASEDGLKALRSERNLELAHVASGGLLERLTTYLETAGRNLRAAKKDLPKYKNNTDVKELLKNCRDALKDLESND